LRAAEAKLAATPETLAGKRKESDAKESTNA
jgi:hypothetical protein